MRTRLYELLEIEVPIIQAAIWPATTPELVAEVNRAGAIGSLGAVFASAEVIAEEIHRTRELTARPFIVNHVVPQLDEEAFEATLDARPAVVSFALGHAGGLVERAHEAGAKAIHQIHTVEQARAAAALGVDAIIAQGSEAGGQGMSAGPSTLALVPQVVDAVAPIPVIAAGGIGDGRGIAAVLAAGAAGVNLGTRFLASEEARSDPAWRDRIVASESEDAVRFEGWGSSFRKPVTRLTRWSPAYFARSSSIATGISRMRGGWLERPAPSSGRHFRIARRTNSFPSRARAPASSTMCSRPGRL